MTFGKRLMQLRKEHGYRNRDTFAAELGIPANTLRNYEMDIREPGFPFLIKISQFFSRLYRLPVRINRRKSDYSCRCSIPLRTAAYREISSSRLHWKRTCRLHNCH